MISVLFDARFITPERTGVGRVTEHLLDALLQNHPEIKLHVLHNTGLPERLKGENPIEIATFFDSHPGGDFHRNIILRRIISENELDVYFSPAFYSIQRGKSIPQVVLIHDLAVFDQPGSENPAFRLYLRKMIQSSIRNAAIITTPSEFIRERILHKFDITPESIKAVHLGVDASFGVYDDARAEALKTHYCLPNRFFLNVSTVEPRKNLLNLLDGYAIYKRRSQSPIPLVIIGKDGFDADKIHSRAQRADLSTHVRFLGYVPESDMGQLYGLAYGLVFPSLYEGFGLPILEAMLAGCPVITSNCSSMPEVAGNAGLLIDPNNTLSIASAMDDICKKPTLRRRLSIEGRQRAQTFTWADMAASYASLFEQALKIRKGN